MGLSGARGDLTEARTRRVGPPRPKEHKVPGTFRPNRPGQKKFVSRVRACDGNGLVLCERGTREARTAHGFGGEGPKIRFTTPRPPPAKGTFQSTRTKLPVGIRGAY